MQKGKRKHYIFVSFTTEAAARKAIAKERQEIHGRLVGFWTTVVKFLLSTVDIIFRLQHLWFYFGLVYHPLSVSLSANVLHVAAKLYAIYSRFVLLSLGLS